MNSDSDNQNRDKKGESDNQDQTKKHNEGCDYYKESAKQESIYAAWTELYFAMAFKPYETTQKVAELIWEAHGRQQKDAREYWQEAEKQVWGPNLELIRTVAYFMWEMAGKQPEMAISFWVAAQKYIASLIALATKLNTNPDNLMEAFLSPAVYFHRVQDLAQTMCRRAGQQVMMPALSFWLSAENHILMMMAGVTTAVQTVQDATSYSGRIFETFSHERYLNHIQKNAYYKWEKEGKPFGKELEHWFQTEEETLARIREGIDNNTILMLQTD